MVCAFRVTDVSQLAADHSCDCSLASMVTTSVTENVSTEVSITIDQVLFDVMTHPQCKQLPRG